MKRRDLLTQTALASLLPALSTGTANAAAAKASPKLLMLYLPSGMPVSRSGAEQDIVYDDPLYWHRSDFSQLSWIQSPLAPYRSQLLLLKNLQLDPTSHMGHHLQSLWTGTNDGNRASFDYLLSQQLTGTEPLNLGCFLGDVYEPKQIATYAPDGLLRRPEQDPDQSFRRWIAPRLSRRKSARPDSALQRLLAPVQFIQPELGLPPRAQAPERHLGPTQSNSGIPIKELIQSQLRLLVSALKLGTTQVGTLQISYPHNSLMLDFPEIQQLYDQLGATHPNVQKRNHPASHDPDRRIHAAQGHWFMQQVAYLLGLLKREGLLDSTLVLVTTETADAQYGIEWAMPWFVAGGRDFLQTGRQLDCRQGGHSALLLALAQKLDVRWPNFGISTEALNLS